MKNKMWNLKENGDFCSLLTPKVSDAVQPSNKNSSNCPSRYKTTESHFQIFSSQLAKI